MFLGRGNPNLSWMKSLKKFQIHRYRTKESMIQRLWLQIPHNVILSVCCMTVQQNIYICTFDIAMQTGGDGANLYDLFQI